MDAHFEKRLLKKIEKIKGDDGFKEIFWDILYHSADRHGATLVSSTVNFGKNRYEIYPTGLLRLRFLTLQDLSKFVIEFEEISNSEYGLLAIDLLDGVIGFRGAWYDLELNFGDDSKDLEIGE